MSKINFTQASLNSLSCPADKKRMDVHDSKCLGLIVTVFASGTKTFYVYKRVNGRPDRIKVGSYPNLSVERARKKAREILAQIDEGINPKDQQKKNRNEITFGALFDEYIEQHAKQHKKTWQEDVNNNRLHLQSLRAKKLSAITPKIVQDIHVRIGRENGQYQANRILALISSVFNKAMQWGYDCKNPTIGIQKFKERSRSRWLQPDEMQAFFKSLSEEPSDTMRDYFYMLLYTGARRRNVGSMRWQDIDLEKNIWHIQETKNGDPQDVPLTQLAKLLLEERLAKAGDSEWVFPSASSASGHIEEPKKVWKSVCERAGIKDLRIHDLRRTLGTMMGVLGVGSPTIGKALNHRSLVSTAIYTQSNMDIVAKAMELATQTIHRHGNQQAGDDV